MANALYNWRAGTIRSANAIEAHPQRLTSADGTRWALGRNVKRALPDHHYDSVEVWSLRTRVNGKAVVVDAGLDREAADRWINFAPVNSYVTRQGF